MLWSILWLGCPSTIGLPPAARVGEDRVAQPGECPARDLDISQLTCQDLPDAYGTPAAPLEWGPGASGRTLWFERLLCASGATPKTLLVGPAGTAGPSRSPRAATAEGTGDSLDTWIVACPGEEMPRQLTTNRHRCGNPCPPAGMGLLPADAAVALDRSEAALGRGDLAVAMENARAASDAAPMTEATLSWKGMVQLEVGYDLQALQSFAGAAALNQDDPFYPAQEAIALERLDQPEKADRLLGRILDDLSADDPAHGRITCQRAWLWRRMGNPLADGLAGEACKAGVDACCPKRWAE